MIRNREQVGWAEIGFLLIWGASVSFGPGIAVADRGRVEIVDRSIEHHGGERYRESLTELRLCSKSGCYDLTARVDGGWVDLEVVGPAGGHQRRAKVSNDTVELWRDGAPIQLSDTDSSKIRDWVMARVYFVFLPFRLDDPSVIQQDLGLESWGERQLHKIKVTFVPESSSGAEDEFLFWFDPQNQRLVQFAYSFSGNPGGLRFRRAFNYRRIGGILFFDQENWGMDGPGLTVEEIDPETLAAWQLISTVTLHEIRVSDLDPAATRVD